MRRDSLTAKSVPDQVSAGLDDPAETSYSDDSVDLTLIRWMLGHPDLQLIGSMYVIV